MGGLPTCPNVTGSNNTLSVGDNAAIDNNVFGDRNIRGNFNISGDHNVNGYNNVVGNHNVYGKNNVVGNNNVIGDNNLIIQFRIDTEDDEDDDDDNYHNHDNHYNDNDYDSDMYDDGINSFMDEKQNNNQNTNTNTNTNTNSNNYTHYTTTTTTTTITQPKKLNSRKRKLDHDGMDSNPQKVKKRKLNKTDVEGIKQQLQTLRLKYSKINEFINHLLSLNGKDLENILLLSKRDIIMNLNNISKVLIYNKNNLIFPKISQRLDTFSLYGVLFEAINGDNINNAHQQTHTYSLWDILLQDRFRDPNSKNIIMNEFMIRAWIGQLLVAVNVLHENNIVHLDISPESIKIKIDNEDNNNTLLLTGFNTIRFVKDYNVYTLNDIDNKLLNCCWQLPPIINKRNYFIGSDLKSFDLWSIGKVTLLLFTAFLPENRKTISNIANDFINQLLSNQLTAKNALNHAWMKMSNNNNLNHDIINIDSNIYLTMYQHHQQRLKNKNEILAQQIKYLLISDQKDLNKEIKKLNEKISKYENNNPYMAVDKSCDMEEKKNLKTNIFNDKQPDHDVDGIKSAMNAFDDEMRIIKKKIEDKYTNLTKVKGKNHNTNI